MINTDGRFANYCIARGGPLGRNFQSLPGRLNLVVLKNVSEKGILRAVAQLNIVTGQVEATATICCDSIKVGNRCLPVAVSKDSESVEPLPLIVPVDNIGSLKLWHHAVYIAATDAKVRASIVPDSIGCNA